MRFYQRRPATLAMLTAPAPACSCSTCINRCYEAAISAPFASASPCLAQWLVNKNKTNVQRMRLFMVHTRTLTKVYTCTRLAHDYPQEYYDAYNCFKQ